MIKKGIAVFIAVLFFISQPATVYSQAVASEVLQPGADISLTPEEKKYLSDVFKDTWNYLSVFVDPATGIPYDSDKKQPATSLSNVGLYVAATAIAAETGLIGKGEAVTRINMALTSLDKAPDWLGIPRVWISARGLKGIQGTEMFSYSKHVSNLIGGLELAQSVFPAELGGTVDGWLEGMDFSGMYDGKTGWIKGGYDIPHKNFAVSQPFGPWYYKFLASEARLISFYLIAKGLAPASHWKALDRTIQKDGDKWFFVSSYEDGGAYMPYMASLYIDETNTEMGLSQKNFSMHQMERSQKAGAPVWGLSASLDTKGEYIPYGQLTDRVVTPYASMLAALHFPEEAAKNLKKLDELGVRPNEVYTDRRTNFAAFSKEGAAAKPWALLEDGEVFFLNKSGAIEKISDYVDWSKRFNEVSNYDKETLKKFLEKMGYRMGARDTADVYVKKVFGPSVLKSGWQDALGDNTKQKELLGLASAAGLYFPGWIQFQDGRKTQVAFSEEQGVLKPWAVVDGDTILFLNSGGEIESLNPQIKSVKTAEKITTIDKEALALFEPLFGPQAVRPAKALGLPSAGISTTGGTYNPATITALPGSPSVVFGKGTTAGGENAATIMPVPSDIGTFSVESYNSNPGDLTWGQIAWGFFDTTNVFRGVGANPGTLVTLGLNGTTGREMNVEFVNTSNLKKVFRVLLSDNQQNYVFDLSDFKEPLAAINFVSAETGATAYTVEAKGLRALPSLTGGTYNPATITALPGSPSVVFGKGTTAGGENAATIMPVPSDIGTFSAESYNSNPGDLTWGQIAWGFFDTTNVFRGVGANPGTLVTLGLNGTTGREMNVEFVNTSNLKKVFRVLLSENQQNYLFDLSDFKEPLAAINFVSAETGATAYTVEAKGVSAKSLISDVPGVAEALKSAKALTAAELLAKSGNNATTSNVLSIAEHVLPAYSFKDGFGESLSVAYGPSALADLLALAVANGQMLPAQIKLKLDIPGNFGFRDAYDWQNKKVEKHYLTPSQGMGFLALANVLHDQVVRKKFSQDPDISRGLQTITPSPAELANWDAEAQKCSAPARLNPERFAVS